MCSYLGQVWRPLSMAIWASSHDVFRRDLCERRWRPEVLRAARVSYQNRDNDFREDLSKTNEIISQEGLCNRRSGRECR